jgi:hypothetical protein
MLTKRKLVPELLDAKNQIDQDHPYDIDQGRRLFRQVKRRYNQRIRDHGETITQALVALDWWVGSDRLLPLALIHLVVEYTLDRTVPLLDGSIYSVGLYHKFRELVDNVLLKIPVPFSLSQYQVHFASLEVAFPLLPKREKEKRKTIFVLEKLFTKVMAIEGVERTAEKDQGLLSELETLQDSAFELAGEGDPYRRYPAFPPVLPPPRLSSVKRLMLPHKTPTEIFFHYVAIWGTAYGKHLLLVGPSLFRTYYGQAGHLWALFVVQIGSRAFLLDNPNGILVDNMMRYQMIEEYWLHFKISSKVSRHVQGINRL